MLEIRPISLRQANEFVDKYHRHNKATVGNKFSLACYDNDHLCGVAICGRPLSRMLDDGKTLEILRNCTDGTRNACSKLYGASVRVARAMGYKKVITYTISAEDGASLKASNFSIAAENCGGGVGTRLQDQGAKRIMTQTKRQDGRFCYDRNKT